VTVSGVLQWSLEEGRLAEGRLQALWQVDKKLQLVGDVSRTAPDLFIDRSSIFAVFSEELRNEAAPRWSTGSSSRSRWRPTSTGCGWKAATATERGRGPRTGRRMGLLRGRAAAARRARQRLYAGARLRHPQAAAGHHHHARPRRVLAAATDHGSKHSFVGTLTGGWAFLPNWEAMIATSLGVTPYFERRTEVIARLSIASAFRRLARGFR